MCHGGEGTGQEGIIIVLMGHGELAVNHEVEVRSVQMPRESTMLLQQREPGPRGGMVAGDMASHGRCKLCGILVYFFTSRRLRRGPVGELRGGGGRMMSLLAKLPPSSRGGWRCFGGDPERSSGRTPRVLNMDIHTEVTLIARRHRGMYMTCTLHVLYMYCTCTCTPIRPSAQRQTLEEHRPHH